MKLLIGLKNYAEKEIKNTSLEYFLRALFRVIKVPIILKENFILYCKIKKHKNFKKIIYAITPPSSFRNIGDHAQVIAIKKWLKDNFKSCLILEFDKNEIYRCLFVIKKIVNRGDLIFLHSGANLGVSGLWSEGARRLVIKNFPENKIISLPQTIFFSNTQKGKEQLKITKNTYNRHKDLTIMARDAYSFKLAKEYFPKCKTMSCPDFVLYLRSPCNNNDKREKVLLCLRNDWESILSSNMRNVIKDYIERLNEDYDVYDTTLDRDIPRKNREKEFENGLSVFRKHKLVITDKLHAVIFSVITKTPCIALATVSHKLAESVKWFNELNYITYIDDYTMLPEMTTEMLKVKDFNSIDYRSLYFNGLKSKLL